MINLSNFLGEEKYFDFAAKHIAFGMDNYKFFQKRFKKDRPHYYYPFGQLWTMSELDDCGAMGASMIEVHITMNKALSGPDHKASLNRYELGRMVQGVRNIEKALGSYRKAPTKSELKVRDIIREKMEGK